MVGLSVERERERGDVRRDHALPPSHYYYYYRSGIYRLVRLDRD